MTCNGLANKQFADQRGSSLSASPGIIGRSRGVLHFGTLSISLEQVCTRNRVLSVSPTAEDVIHPWRARLGGCMV
jgi:hypothetical protein